MKLTKQQKWIILGLGAMILLIGGGFNLTLINVNKIWPIEKAFDNPWATNNGSPRILQASQWENGVSESTRNILVSNTGEVIGLRVEYLITYLDGASASNSPDVKIDFNGVNVKTLRFMPGSKGTSQTGSVNIPLDLLQSSNQITVSHTNAWGGWSKVSYDVVLVFGYNASPTVPPSQGGGGTNNGTAEDFITMLIALLSGSFLFGIPNWLLLVITFGAIILLDGFGS